MDVNYIPPSVHGNGNGVECFALSFAPGTDLSSVYSVNIAIDITGGSVFSYTMNPGLSGATSAWLSPLTLQQRVDGISLFGFAWSFSVADLSAHNNPFLEVCIQVDEGQDPCLLLGNNSLTSWTLQNGFTTCQIGFPTGGGLCIDDLFPPPTCDDIDVLLEYRGWSDGKHEFWFSFTAPAIIKNVTDINLNIQINSGGTGVFDDPAFDNQLVDQTLFWIKPAQGSVTPDGSRIIFSAAKDPSPPYAASGDFSNVIPYFLQLQIPEIDPSVDYCIGGPPVNTSLNSWIVLELEDGSILSCDLTEKLFNAAVCTVDPLVDLDIFGSIRTEWSCDDAPPGMANRDVEVSDLTGGVPLACNTSTDILGNYGCNYSAMPNALIRITPSDEGIGLCDITTNDLFLLYAHITMTQIQTDAYAIIAMDVDDNHIVTIDDVLDMLNYILGRKGIDAPVWKMIPEDDYRAMITGTIGVVIPPYDPYVQFLAGDPFNPNFWGVKTGDVDRSCDVCSQSRIGQQARDELALTSTTKEVHSGYELSFAIPHTYNVNLLDVTFSYSGDIPIDLEVVAPDRHIDHSAFSRVDEDASTIRAIMMSSEHTMTDSWKGESVITFRSHDVAFLEHIVMTEGVAYDNTGLEEWDLVSHGRATEHKEIHAWYYDDVLHIQHDRINQDAVMSIYDASGRLIKHQEVYLDAHQLQYTLPLPVEHGLYMLHIQSADGSSTVVKVMR